MLNRSKRTGSPAAIEIRSQFHIGRAARNTHGETEGLVEPLRIAREQGYAAQVLKIRVLEKELDHPTSISSAASVGSDDDIGEVSVGCEIGDRAGEGNDASVLVDTSTQRVGDRSLEHVSLHGLRPVSIPEHSENGLHI